MDMKSIQRSAPGSILATLVVLAGAVSAQDERSALALDLVNEARQAEGLEPLTWADALAAAAQVHANDMLARDYFDHLSPEGETVRDRFLDEGGGAWLQVAENIAMCRGCPTPPGPDRVSEFHQGWMESPEHRAAILDPGVAEFGSAVSWRENVAYAVQTFAGPGQSEGADETATEAAPDELTDRALQAVNEAREVEGLDALAVSAALDEAATRLTEAGAVSDAEGALSEALDVVGETWASVGMVAGECGGCGSRPTAADAEEFVSDWLDEPSLRQTLLEPQATSFGFALTADGEGRKGAVALTEQ
jgi:uncharacterized protein YkwD